MHYSEQVRKLMLNGLSKQFLTFHKHLDSRDVASKKLSPLELPFPERGMDFEDLNALIKNNIQPRLSASNGGRYWGFVTGGANPVATYADWLVSTFNQNVSKGGDSVATAIEQQALDWICQLFELPNLFKGLFTTGATAANLLAAFVAREHAGREQGINVTKQGMVGLEVKVMSSTPHASMIKSLGMAGLGQNCWQAIECQVNSEAMKSEALEAALINNKGKSKIVIASAATVTGTDYDDLVSISKLCKKHHAWLHVDAAFGIFERLISGRNGKTKGLELADSITLDCHKWLNVPYDCGVFLTRHVNLLQDCCEVIAPYFGGTQDDIPFMSLGIENSRRFRAFPVWATIMAYGKEGIRKQVQCNIDQAKALADWIDASDKFELVKTCELNVVLFKPKLSKLSISAEECLATLNASGEVFLTPGAWKGETILRAALSNWSTTSEDIKRVIAVLDEI